MMILNSWEMQICLYVSQPDVKRYGTGIIPPASFDVKNPSLPLFVYSVFEI